MKIPIGFLIFATIIMIYALTASRFYDSLHDRCCSKLHREGINPAYSSERCDVKLAKIKRILYFKENLINKTLDYIIEQNDEK